jgi:hypothetical protein
MKKSKERINIYREKLSFVSFHAYAKETRVLPGGVCRGSGEARSVSDFWKNFSCRVRKSFHGNKR